MQALTPINKPSKLKFWNFVNSGEDEAELYIYGVICNGEGWIYEWFGMEATDQVQFIKDLKALGTKKNITVYINSLGGDVYAAQTILDVLKRNPANITVYIDGIAASAASVIAMAGDKIIMPLNAQIMIHDPLVDLYGQFNASDMEKMKDFLDQIKSGIIAAYMTKSNMSEKEIAKLMSKETWLTAKQALEMGFADEILYDKSIEVVNAGKFLIVNSLSFDVSKLQSNPFIKLKEEGADPMSNPTTNSQSTQVETQPGAQAVAAPGFQPVVNQTVTPPVNQPAAPAQPAAAQSQTVDAAAAERQRLMDIDAIAAGIDPALVNEAKYTNPMSASELAFKAMKEGKITNMSALNATIAANQAAGVNNVQPGAVDQSSDPQLDLSKTSDLNKAFAIIAANAQAGRMGFSR